MPEPQVQVIYAGNTPLDPKAEWVVVSYALLVRPSRTKLGGAAFHVRDSAGMLLEYN